MSTTRPDPRAAGGFSIIAALFILVVLAGLGGFILSTSSTQHLTLAQDVLNARARLASRAGVEWAAYHVGRASAFRTACQAAGASFAGPGPATQVLAPGDLAGLAEFRVDVSCRSQSYDEAGFAIRVYQIVATACTSAAGCPAGAVGTGYVEHRQTASFRN